MSIASRTRSCKRNVVLFYFSDETFDCCEISNPDNNTFEPGDILKINRDEQRRGDTAVLIGNGANAEEAANQAQAYLTRVAKWDGVEGASQLLFFGCDVSQSQFVQELSQRNSENFE